MNNDLSVQTEIVGIVQSWQDPLWTTVTVKNGYTVPVLTKEAKHLWIGQRVTLRLDPLESGPALGTQNT